MLSCIGRKQWGGGGGGGGGLYVKCRGKRKEKQNENMRHFDVLFYVDPNFLVIVPCVLWGHITGCVVRAFKNWMLLDHYRIMHCSADQIND